MLRMLLASIWTLVDGLQAHDAHQTTHAVSSCREPRFRSLCHNLTAAKEWVLPKNKVNLMHLSVFAKQLSPVSIVA